MTGAAAGDSACRKGAVMRRVNRENLPCRAAS
jgi:hypothetical protein